MPTPCQRCGDIFDLNDGKESKKWYPNTVICTPCAATELAEIGIDEEIQELKDNISDALTDISGWQDRLEKLVSNDK